MKAAPVPKRPRMFDSAVDFERALRDELGLSKAAAAKAARGGFPALNHPRDLTAIDAALNEALADLRSTTP
jgi:hypothetical protein